ncbi:Variable major protein (plasmid) [Borrelia coriaceae ATCC 43381]|uniref:Variable large protein n=1 Tax=Borrelia coriaceae ATCC 43381 TaxID=1408429 RepID=W5SW85_9SPIR|nr:Variable major protein [Borrelia coriaceae ATCC 43381]
MGFSVVKPEDNRSKVKEHFEKIKKGLEDTNNKLKELSGKISGAKNADESTIKIINGAIKGASDVFEQLIAALTKLASASGSTAIGDANTGSAAVGADKGSVDTVIESVKMIVSVADKSGVRVDKGTSGGAVNATAQTDATAILSGTANAQAGPKLASQVVQADPWAMVYKIKDSITNSAQLTGNDKDAGALATGAATANNNGAGAKTNADLAAAVALKAMTKGGKFSVNAGSGEAEAVKGAAANAVNKVLGVVDWIIRKTVVSNLDKIGKSLKGIKYSETTGEAIESSTANN